MSRVNSIVGKKGLWPNCIIKKILKLDCIVAKV